MVSPYAEGFGSTTLRGPGPARTGKHSVLHADWWPIFLNEAPKDAPVPAWSMGFAEHAVIELLDDRIIRFTFLAYTPAPATGRTERQ